MPKQTFLSLPEEKRVHILDCALDEFSQRGYEKSSINRIVEAAGIAKGSFYQYFVDKFDLYQHIISVYISNVKIDVISSAQTEEELGRHDFFDLIAYMFRNNAANISRDPRVAKLGMDLARSRGSDVYKRIMAPYAGYMDSFYYVFIKLKQEAGEIASDVDAQMLNYMLLGLTEYIYKMMEESESGILAQGAIDKFVSGIRRILTCGIFASNLQPGEQVE